MNRSIRLSILAATLAATSVGAYAAQATPQNDALAVTSAKTSLIQAVTLAEQHAGGKASEAEFKHSKDGPIYKVEIVNGTQVFDVKVDADKGTVISQTKDTADHDEDDH